MGIEGFVAAASRSEAMYWTQKAANEVGYPVKFTEVKVNRAPEFDEWATERVRYRCWTRETLLNSRSHDLQNEISALQ
jgi:hypothetical protein